MRLSDEWKSSIFAGQYLVPIQVPVWYDGIVSLVEYVFV